MDNVEKLIRQYLSEVYYGRNPHKASSTYRKILNAHGKDYCETNKAIELGKVNWLYR